ncbi:hypothetical protein [Dactylosporangium sp. CA-092794]|uniref:hypothetical protein n=1 Tax=Dactylosporangium sp. CA-092794 TaxID=3239929 RepID=UPI003D8BA8E3
MGDRPGGAGGGAQREPLAEPSGDSTVVLPVPEAPLMIAPRRADTWCRLKACSARSSAGIELTAFVHDAAGPDVELLGAAK